MKTHAWTGLSGIIVVLMGTHFSFAQQVNAPAGVLEKLGQQPSAENRKATIVPSDAPQSAGERISPGDKERRIEDLIEQVEATSGAQVGTVKATDSKGATINLQHDLAKVRENFHVIADAPFGSAISHNAINSGNKISNTPATVEYRATDKFDQVERVVSIKSKDSVAANAFRSGQQPVTLKVENARLTASQINTTEPQPPVKIQVGNETRELNVGDVGRFGMFDVTVLASANRSAKPSYEGLPYVLRIQVMPVQ